MALVVPVDDLAAGVAAWSRVLGAEPTFVDGDRWAQFDVAGGRIALAGTDRATAGPAPMLKVDDVDTARTVAGSVSWSVGPVVDGRHERRCTATTDGGDEVLLHDARTSGPG